jgi:RimJ/RimL family protein N-acetyltransferase
VRDDDLDALFAQQREPEGNAMAVFPARDRVAFDAHWERIAANPTAIVRVIDADGEVAGNVGSWEQDGQRFVGYWLGEFVQELPRPLHAWVASSNSGSIRVLEKCGFARVDERTTDVEEFLYELR